MTTTQDISAMTIPQLKAALTDLGVDFKSKEHKADLQVKLENALIAQAQQEEKPQPSEQAVEAAADAIEAASPVRGLHYRGKALGLKHYRAMGLATGRTQGKREGQKPAGVPNSERVQKYVRASGVPYPMLPKLTHAQYRRVLKKRTPADGLVIRDLSQPKREGEALLARTPDGLGIFHQFSK